MSETPIPPTVETPAPLPEEPVAPAAPVAEAPVPRVRVPEHGVFLGTGRRKTAVARVRIKPGTGKILINKRALDKFFTEDIDRNAVMAPLNAVGVAGRFDVSVNVNGGGHTGQAGAVLLGLSRALVHADDKAEGPLREAGYLTRDAREVERKKYGRRKARRRFQFSKR